MTNSTEWADFLAKNPGVVIAGSQEVAQQVYAAAPHREIRIDPLGHQGPTPDGIAVWPTPLPQRLQDAPVYRGPRSAAAHIITADAVALGDPEIIIMTRADETGAAEEIERIDFDGTAEMSAVQTLLRLAHGWRVVSGPTEAATGYYIVDIEKV